VTTSAHVAGFSRLALAPAVLIILYDTPVTRMFGVVIIVAAGVSDILDGWLARRYGTVSAFGVFLDTTADKVFAAVALVGLLSIGRIPIAIVAIFLIREYLIMGLRAYAAAQGLVVAASPLGSAKTIVLFIGLGVVLLARDAGLALLWIATALAVVSGIDYAVAIGRRVRHAT
jgi:CDP-diacylglycerol---glycerol-3-phosphate 3-phosphatidyltransferase